ncbi:hypothetical protein ABZ419_12195 [Streptomyces cinnamoneus]|uniref:hypothetical protein n=1 Tax=Streptomyces cinnamoneus TaxID=53446 RepID=UPI0033C34F91
MSTWHLNTDQPLYTRQAEPEQWTSRMVPSGFALLRFDDATLRRWLAVHEAGHAVLDFAGGIPVVEIHLCDDLGKVPGEGGAAWVRTGRDWSVPYVRYLAMCAAGERAQERWMREEGLWSSERAWVTERGATDDRAQAAHALRETRGMDLTYGPVNGAGMDYATVQAAADAALAPLWDRVLRLAAAVDEHGHLSGREAARYAGMAHVAVPCDETEAVAA